VVIQPGWLVTAVLAVTGLGLAISLSNREAAGGASRAAATSLASVLTLAIIGVLVWIVVSRLRPDMGVVEGYLSLASFVLVLGLVLGWRQRRSRSGHSAAGAALLWWLLALAATLIGLGTSLLFALPALLATVALVLRRGPARGEPAVTLVVVAEALTSAVAIVLLIPAIDVFFQFAQPRPGNPDSELLWMMAIPLTLVGMLIELPGTRPGQNASTKRAARRIARST